MDDVKPCSLSGQRRQTKDDCAGWGTLANRIPSLNEEPRRIDKNEVPLRFIGLIPERSSTFPVTARAHLALPGSGVKYIRAHPPDHDILRGERAKYSLRSRRQLCFDGGVAVSGHDLTG